MRDDLGWFGLVILVTAGFAYLAFLTIGAPLTGVDDANIFMTYGRNLAHGQGFVFNAGGERVEGFTSLLWVLICAVAYLFTDAPERTLAGVNVLLVSLAVFSATRFIVRDICKISPSRFPPHWFALVLLGWIYTSPSFVTWTTISLMDTGLYCAVFTLGTVAVARAAAEKESNAGVRAWTVAACVAVMLLTRPEGMLIAAVWIGGLLLGSYVSTGHWWSSLRRCLLPAGTYFLILAGLFAFRLSYFGYPLPNTYYAKVSPSIAYNLRQGFMYFWQFAAMQPFVTLCFISTLVGILRFGCCVYARRSTSSDKERREIGLPKLKIGLVSAGVLTGIVIPVLTGGDHFVLFRVYQPVWPLLAVPFLAYLVTDTRETAADAASGRQRRNSLTAVPVPAAASTESETGAARQSPPANATADGGGYGRSVGYGVLGGILIGLYLVSYPTWTQMRRESRIKKEFEIAQETRAVGRALNRINDKTTPVSVGTIATGGVGLTYQGKVVDLMGLNSVAMGHSPGSRHGHKNHAAFNPDVFFQLSPDIVFPRLQPEPDPAPLASMAHPRSFHNRVLRGLIGSSPFRRLYVPVCIGVPSGTEVPAAWISGWCQHDLVDRLKERGLRVVAFGDDTLKERITAPPQRSSGR